MATARTARTTILTTPDFKAWLSSEAEKEGVSVSELVRQRCQPQPQFSETEELLLSALADEMEKSNKEAIKVFDAGMEKLNSVLNELQQAREEREKHGSN